MKKVGIVTFHCAKNYGALLQAYALQHTVEGIGNECDIVDYRCESMINAYKPFQFNKKDPVKSLLKTVLMFNKRKKRIKNFNSFYTNYLKLSPNGYSRQEMINFKDNYDIFISGSDQVWGMGAPGAAPDSTYFLGFADDKQKYSYAASFGRSDIPDEKVPVMNNLLKGFQSFSVREQSAVPIIKKAVDKEATVHVDPSFLLTKEEWAKIAVKKVDTPYILIFNVQPPKSMIDFAKKLSKEKNIPIIYINDNPHKSEDNITYVVAPSVEEFIGYIQNATYVVTNSFHGTAFSTIFHKDLFVEYETARSHNDRAQSLLDMVGINREIKDGNATHTEIDWNNVSQIIDEQRNKSIAYLKEITM